MLRRVLVPPLLNTISQGGGGWVGGFTGKNKIKTLFHTILGRVGQGAWQLGSAIFLVTLACLDISSKKRCLYRLFIYHFKAHTISNKLVSKVFAQKKGKKSYNSSKYVFNFWWFQVSSPLKTVFNMKLTFLYYTLVIFNKCTLTRWRRKIH